MLSGLWQAWGGVFYLLNKIFFSQAERSIGKKKQTWKQRSWLVYLIGLPAWIILFVSQRNWIAMALETSGAPSMFLGLINARRQGIAEPLWLKRLAQVLIAGGLCYSLYDFGGLTTMNQGLELSLTGGFLIGTYQLAQNKPSGYLWYMLMNLSCGLLMYIQGFLVLVAQQAISLLFVVDAYRMHRQED